MAALQELEAAYARRKKDKILPRRVPPPAGRLRRPPHAAVSRRAAHQGTWRREDLPEARRPAAHRRAQDQQLHRTGAAGAPHGQASHHRRDRRRPARRRHRHGVRAVRHGVRGLHGHRRHAAAGAECLPHAAAGRRGARRGVGFAHAERRHQRSHARLGHQRPHHALSAGQRAGSASLSDDGARLPSRHRPGGAQADPAKPKAVCRRRSSPASAAARMPSACFTNSSRTAR